MVTRMVLLPADPVPLYAQTLELAQNYSRKMNKPFPQFNHSVLEEREQPEDFYVFEGQEGEPTILYMPLFNLQNCQGQSPSTASMGILSTFGLINVQRHSNLLT